jgi:hypothetical protein
VLVGWAANSGPVAQDCTTLVPLHTDRVGWKPGTVFYYFQGDGPTKFPDLGVNQLVGQSYVKTRGGERAIARWGPAATARSGW